MDIDQEIKIFLKFWEAHREEDMVVSGGLLQTKGCQDDYGCCSKHCDLGGLADALEELVGDSGENNVG